MPALVTAILFNFRRWRPTPPTAGFRFGVRLAARAALRYGGATARLPGETSLVYNRPFLDLNDGIWLMDVFLDDSLLDLWLNLDVSDDPGAGTLLNYWLDDCLLT